MLHELLTRALKKHLYVTSFERYKSEFSDTYLERYTAKHIDLKPELIVVNDQPFGFKKSEAGSANLELFPIFCEVEYTVDPDQNRFLEQFDLYAETSYSFRDKLSELISLAEVYSKTIQIERVKRLDDPNSQVVVIYSKLSELFVEEFLEKDMEDDLISEKDLESIFDLHILSFSNFLKVLDEVVIKGNNIQSVNKILIP